MKKNIYIFIVLAVISFFTRFLFFGTPETIIFDEVYFPNYASSYITGEYYFDPHPPLGKLLIRSVGWIGGVNTDATDYSAIGNSFQDDARFWYRLTSATIGFLLPLVIFLLAISLGFSSLIAMAASLFVVFENSLLAQSRFVSIDGMLVLFGFTSLLFYVWYTKSEGKKKVAYHLLSALFACFSFSIKWTGLAYPLIIVLMHMIEQFDIKMLRKSMLKFTKFLAPYICIGILGYLLIFAIHFALLPNSGPGNPFMTPRFQKTLQGNSHTDDPTLQPKGFFGKFFELNYEMYEVNKRMDNTHSYQSKWYTWPLMTRGLFYWQGTHDGVTNRYIYFLGNPLIYWMGACAVLILLYEVLLRYERRRLAYFILIGFLANFVPYAFIGRVMFLYHYQAALIFAILALCFIFEHFILDKKRNFYLFVTLALVLTTFIYFSPLTYGTPLTDEEIQSRMWLKTWR